MERDIVTDSVTEAWERTRGLLFSGFNAGRWLKLGFIAMLGASVMGGGVNFNIQLPGGGFHDGSDGAHSVDPGAIRSVGEGMAWLAQNLAALMLVAAGLVILWVVLFFLVLYIRSVFRFIFVEAVAADCEPSIRGSWGRHTGMGLSLLLWQIVLGLVTLVCIALVALPVILIAMSFARGEAVPIALGVVGIIGVIGFIMLVVLVLALVRALSEDFLVPAMYARRCGIWDGWRHVFRAWSGQFWNVVLFYLLKFLLGIGAGILTLLVLAASMVLMAGPVVSMAIIIMGIAAAATQAAPLAWGLGGAAVVAAVSGGLVYGYLLQVLLLPISVFFQAYALSFVGKLDGSLRTI